MGISIQSDMRFLCDVNENSHFIMNNGTRIKNLKELSDALKYVDEASFMHHVGNNKNDFASWVDHCIGDNALVNEISGIKDRIEIAKRVESRIQAIEKGCNNGAFSEEALSAVSDIPSEFESLDMDFLFGSVDNAGKEEMVSNIVSSSEEIGQKGVPEGKSAPSLTDNPQKKPEPSAVSDASADTQPDMPPDVPPDLPPDVPPDLPPESDLGSSPGSGTGDVPEAPKEPKDSNLGQDTTAQVNNAQPPGEAQKQQEASGIKKQDENPPEEILKETIVVAQELADSKIQEQKETATGISDKHEEMIEIREIENTPLGLKEIDGLFKTGLPKICNLLFVGTMNSGKTLTSLRLMIAVAKKGEKALYISMHDSEEKIINILKSLDKDILNYMNSGNIIVKKLDTFEIARLCHTKMSKAGEGNPHRDFDCTETLGFVEVYSPSLVVVDSLSSLELSFSDDRVCYRHFIDTMFKYFERLGIRSFFIKEIITEEDIHKEFFENILADCILYFSPVKGKSLDIKIIKEYPILFRKKKKFIFF